MAQAEKNFGLSLKRLARRLGILGASPLSMRLCLCGIALCAASLIIFAVSMFILQRNSEVLSKNQQAIKEAAQIESRAQEPEVAEVFHVHVSGEVANPGLYVLSGNDLRIADAIDAAGGFNEFASEGSINLAEPLSDGLKIVVASKQEPQANSAQETGTSTSASTTSKININTATVAELMNLPGVGQSTAEAIVEERTRGGKFTSVEDLMRVSGIGQKKFEKLKDKIYV